MDSKSMYMIMQNGNAKTRDFSFLNLLFLQRLHRFTCVELAGGLLVDQYHHIARPEIWIQLLAPDRPLPRWLDKIPKVFTLDSSFPLSLFLQCSYNPSTSSVFHYLLTSLLFSPYLFNFFFPFSSVCVFEAPACRQSTRVTLSLQNVLAASLNHRIFRNCIEEYGYETYVSSIMEEKPIY